MHSVLGKGEAFVLVGFLKDLGFGRRSLESNSVQLAGPMKRKENEFRHSLSGSVKTRLCRYNLAFPNSLTSFANGGWKRKPCLMPCLIGLAELKAPGGESQIP